jgi:hypothetical protein
MVVWSRSVSLALAISLFSGDASAWADCSAGYQALRSEHLEQALRELLPCAEAGDSRAQFIIGMMYDLGKGTPENHTEAIRWYRRAAEQGIADAQTELGTMYFLGIGVVQDDAEAARWLRSAAEQGIPKAQSHLGAMYAAGHFPLHGLLASEANVTTGTVSALAGIGNDARFLQMTVPVQPGNSGGPLLDLEGRVVGVVVGKLDALKIASVTGDIPQNVNFAIKAEVVRSFLDATGHVSGPGRAETDRSWEDAPLADGPAAVGAEAKAFTVLVECWK